MLGYWKQEPSKEAVVDAIDLAIVGTLVDDARTSFAELAQRVGLSGPSTAERVRKLEERGVIRGYHADLDPEAIGLALTAFVAVTLASPEFRAGFLEGIGHMSRIVECHHVAGDDDFLLKVHVAGTRGLEAFVTDGVKSLPGVARTRTTVVLSTQLARPLAPSPAAAPSE